MIDIGTVLQPGNLFAWILVGLIAGFFASRIVRGHGYGCLGNIIVGLVGSIIGGYIALVLGIGRFSFLGTTFIAFLGACILVVILQFFFGEGKRRHRWKNEHD